MKLFKCPNFFQVINIQYKISLKQGLRQHNLGGGTHLGKAKIADTKQDGDDTIVRGQSTQCSSRLANATFNVATLNIWNAYMTSKGRIFDSPRSWP